MSDPSAAFAAEQKERDDTAEGNGKLQGFKELGFLDDARGSAVECATCLDVSVAKRITKSDRIRPGSLHAWDFEQEDEHEHERERGIRFATAFSLASAPGFRSAGAAEIETFCQNKGGSARASP